MDFARLWDAYPTDYHPCRDPEGSPYFENQCAIRFGLALIDGGVDMSDYPGVKCWHGHGRRHILRGEEIAAWMKRNPSIFGQCEIRTDSDKTTYQGRRGLIFCRNFWGPGNQGDHIDLWNRDHMKGGDAGYIAGSKEVWFWDIERGASFLSEEALAAEKSLLWKKVPFSRLFHGSGPEIQQTGLRPFELEAWVSLLGGHEIDRTYLFSGQVSSLRLRPGSMTEPTNELDVIFRYQFAHTGDTTFFGLMLHQDDGSYLATPLDHIPMLDEDTKIDFCRNGWTTRKHLRLRNEDTDPMVATYAEDQNVYVFAG